MDHLPKLIASTCPDSSIAKQLEIGRTKATNLTKNQLVEEALTELKEHLNINKLYSLIIDETTDISTKKSMAVIIRFHDNVSIKDRFLGLIEVENGTAKGLFETVLKLLKDNNITIENMTGLGADNCSVMMGHKVGVQTKFREINPKIIVMGCICHSLHLCASAAAVKLPKSVEEFLRKIINHFSNSTKRIEGFKEYLEFLKIKPLKLLKTSQTRWLSLQAAVERVLQSWDALKLYFTNAVFTDDLRITSQILENLKTPIYKIYFSFLSYALGYVNTLNKEFQSETCKVDVLLIRLTKLFYEIS
ncbi:zinc finger protein 862-like [Leptinotarsa decemlineata]|uniref:zinc finger protein 862-like n=1 Tax=Leptinotarsa decemlineata TaxID=7539 RepID=UPI003D305B64